MLSLLKGKLALGIASVFVPFVGIIGTVRLAKPRSLWAKHVYATRSPAKLRRSRARFEASRSRYHIVHDRIDDLIGRTPTFTHMSMLEVIDTLPVRPDGPDGAERQEL